MTCLADRRISLKSSPKISHDQLAVHVKKGTVTLSIDGLG